MTQALWIIAALAAWGQTPAAANAELDVDRARAQVVRGALAAIEKSLVTIETIGGAQPLAEVQDPNAAPQRPGRGPQRPGGRPGPGGGPHGPMEERFRLADGPTTGVIVSADGLILTSSINFARNPAIITVILPDGTRKVARRLGVDYIRRLALVKIDATGLTPCEWAKAEDIKIGQYAIACGRGLGGGTPTAALGIVSALGRRNGNAVQTDAKTSPLNYGGPLVDIDGRVLGIIVPMAGAGGSLAGAEWYDSGIGFAVVKERVDRVYDQLLAGRIIEPGKIGVVLEPAEASLIPMLDKLLPSTPGVKIRIVAKKGPAATAGLEAGDRIVALDGQPVSDFLELQRRLSDRAAGEKVKLTIKRTFRRLDVDLTLGRQADISGFEEDSGGPDSSDEEPTTQPSAD